MKIRIYANGPIAIMTFNRSRHICVCVCVGGGGGGQLIFVGLVT